MIRHLVVAYKQVKLLYNNYTSTQTIAQGTRQVDVHFRVHFRLSEDLRFLWINVLYFRLLGGFCTRTILMRGFLH